MGLAIKYEKDWRGRGDLKWQCIANCHIF